MSRSKKWMVAALAVTALMAFAGVASASASRIATGAYPGVLQGSSTGTQSITLNNLTTTCTQSTISATLNKAGDPMVASPTYNECSYYAGLMIVKANTCTYQFNPGAETSPGVFEGTMAIGPAGCAITLTAPGCKQTIPAQSAHASVTYANVGSGSSTRISISADVQGLAYTSEGVNCGPGSGNTGRIQGSWSVYGTNLAGTQVGAFVESRDGLFVTGSSTPQLSAEVLPASISGEQSATSKHRFASANGISLECNNASFSGGISSATSQFDLTPSYSGCTLMFFGAAFSGTVVNTNGCTYRYTVTDSSPYSGSVALVCPEGKALEATASGCTLKVSPQTLGGTTYENAIGQRGRSVVVSASGSKLSYSTSGFGCGTSSGGNMTYSGGTILR